MDSTSFNSCAGLNSTSSGSDLEADEVSGLLVQ